LSAGSRIWAVADLLARNYSPTRAEHVLRYLWLAFFMFVSHNAHGKCEESAVN